MTKCVRSSIYNLGLLCSRLFEKRLFLWLSTCLGLLYLPHSTSLAFHLSWSSLSSSLNFFGFPLVLVFFIFLIQLLWLSTCLSLLYLPHSTSLAFHLSWSSLFSSLNFFGFPLVLVFFIFLTQLLWLSTCLGLLYLPHSTCFNS